MKRVKTCPFCASSNLEFTRDPSGGWVQCFDCAARGPRARIMRTRKLTVEGARYLWNLRPGESDERHTHPSND